MAKRVKAYTVAPYLADSLQYLLPPEDLSVAQWAETYRMLDSKTSAMPGPWRNSMTPYLVEIMNELNNPETEEIVFCKCTQIGGSEALNNMVGYIVMQDPSPAMVVYPTDKLGESVVRNRLQPMLQISPELAKRYDDLGSSLQELQFDGMYLSISGSNSPSSLASKAIKYLFFDEVDKYPGAVKKEADPISLARERTKTFRNSKIYMTSTPTIATGHIWSNLMDCDIEKHYLVPCPHCGKKIELKFDHLKFPSGEGLTISDRADMACYCCQECGAVITDADKDAMLRGGSWEIVRESNRSRKKVGYWINTLYSPFVRFSEIAAEFLRSKDDPERLQNFKNSWLAEPWEDTQLRTSADAVMDKQTELPEFVVPDWAVFLTGGVDVQASSLYWTIRAWGPYITSQNIAHGQVGSFADIERVMNLPYYNEAGDPFTVALALIDSGFNADATYDFCVLNSDWAYPVKGSSHPMTSHYRLSTINKAGSSANGMQLVMVDTDKYKDMIAARMAKERGHGAWMVYNGCDMDYAEQVTAEHKVNVKSGGVTKQKWVPKRSHIDNHYLDTEVYALAAADIYGVRTLHLQEEEQHAMPQTAEQYAPEEAWIQANENWL